jgi:hypothetical protein
MRGTGFLAIWSDVEAADLTSLTGPAKSSFIRASSHLMLVLRISGNGHLLACRIDRA